MIETAGLKGPTQHTRVLFELRNAVIHNSGDLSRNNSRGALADCQFYLQNETNLALSPGLEPFFALHGARVELLPSVFLALRLCMP